MTSYIEKTSGEDNAPKVKSPVFFRALYAEAVEEAESFRRLGKEAYEEYTYSKAQAKNFQFKRANNQHFPIFWSDLQTVKPTCYSQTPKVLITRRFDSANDQEARIMALLGQRLAQTLLLKSDFDATMSRAVDDFLVAGRGIGRVYYEAKFPEPQKQYIPEGSEIPEGVEVLTDDVGMYFEEVPPPEEEAIKVEWIPFDQFFSSPGAKAWCEGWLMGQDKYYDREAFIERFGEDKAKLVKFSYSGKRDDKDEISSEAQENDGDDDKFAKVIEFWNIRDKKTYWLSCDYAEDFLDVQDDIYELDDFYPYPTPMEAGKGKDSNYPICEYVQYRQGIQVLDFLLDRQWRLIKALKAAGVYDANQVELRRLVSETGETDLVPISNFQALVDKGGLDEVIRYLDKSQLAAALLSTYDAIERQKEFIREITGYADIMRGVVQASESATATATKDKFVTGRLSVKRREVQRFARDLIAKMLDLALAKFSTKTIIDMTGADSLSEEDKVLAISAIAKLRSDRLRGFKVEIETDSTISIDREIEREGRFKLFEVLTNFFGTVGNVREAAPEALDAMKESALHALATIREGQSLEGSVRSSFENMVAAANEPQEPPIDPRVEIEMEKLRAEDAKSKMEIEVRMLELDVERERIALEREKLMVESQRSASENQLEAIKSQLEEMQVKLDTFEAMKVEASQIEAAPPAVVTSQPAPMPVIHIHNAKESSKKVGKWVGNEFVVEDVAEVPLVNG